MPRLVKHFRRAATIAVVALPVAYAPIFPSTRRSVSCRSPTVAHALHSPSSTADSRCCRAHVRPISRRLSPRAEGGSHLRDGLLGWAALTYLHTNWRQENIAGANAALERLAPTREARLAKAGTPRERMYGAAVEAYVATGVAEPQRARAFMDTMYALARAYPADLDARAFAALAGLTVNGLWPPADPAQRAREHDVAEAFAMGVFKESPRHPGGVHYVIHVNDDPTYASAHPLPHAHTRRSHLTLITRSTCRRTSSCSSASGTKRRAAMNAHGRVARNANVHRGRGTERQLAFASVAPVFVSPAGSVA